MTRDYWLTTTDRENIKSSLLQLAPGTFYSRCGKTFLGAHQRRDGLIEIVFDRQGLHRSVWIVTSGQIDLDTVQRSCCRAIHANEPMLVLYQDLQNAGVRMECIRDAFAATLRPDWPAAR
jgi:hypothetical protein